MKWLCPQCRQRFDAPDARCPDDGTPLVADRAGQSVGGCVLEALIGVGRGGATIWEAARGDEPRVAVKVVPVEGEAQRDALQAAARRIAAVRHPHLVSIHGHGSTVDGDVYVIMELLEGVSLGERLGREAPLAPAQAVAITARILDALGAAHAEGLPHLDLEPADIFLGDDDGDGPTVTVLDVGLTRPEAPDPPLGRPDEDPPADALRYRAPELFATGQGDAQSDLYAVGALLVHLLTGRPPFEGSRADLRRAHLTRPVPRLADRGVELPALETAQAVVERLMAKQPAERFAGAAEARLAVMGLATPPAPSDVDDEGFLDEMEDSFENLPQMDHAPDQVVVPPPLDDPPPPPPPRRPPDPEPPPLAGGPRWPLIAAIVLLAGVALFLVLRPPTPPPAPPADAATVTTAAADSAAPPPRPADAAPVAPPPPDAAPVDASPVDAAPTARLNTLASTPEGASIRLADGQLLGKTPWSGILPTDVRRLTLTLEGHAPQTVTLSAEEARRGGWSRALELEPEAKQVDPEAVKRWKARQADRQAAAAEARAAAEATARALAAERAARVEAKGDEPSPKPDPADGAAIRPETPPEPVRVQPVEPPPDKPAATGVLPIGKPAAEERPEGKPRKPRGIITLGEGDGPATGDGKSGEKKVDLLGGD